MHKTSTIFPILLLAFAISLSSCVNEVKNPAKAQDTLARLAISYNIPDSNNILAVNFNALLTPLWKPQYRIDWNFGDSTGMISKFDTSILPHYFSKFGSYLVTLKVVDTMTNVIIGKTSVILDLKDNAIDTNFLHEFTKVSMDFSVVRQYDTTEGIFHLGMDFHSGNPIVQWNANYFSVSGYSSNNPVGFISIRGKISYSANIIDSGIYTFDQEEEHTSGQHYFECSAHGNIISFQNLTRIKQDSNTIIYTSSGPQLEKAMSSNLEYYFSESHPFIFNCNPIKDYYDIDSKILWDKKPVPTLTVTFSK